MRLQEAGALHGPAAGPAGRIQQPPGEGLQDLGDALEQLLEQLQRVQVVEPFGFHRERGRLLRGDYTQSDDGKLILPSTVLRRLDCVLEPTKEAGQAEKKEREGQGLDPEPFLLRIAGQDFYHTSAMSMKTLMGDQDNIGEHRRSYIQAFTSEVRDIFERVEFHLQMDRLEKSGLLYLRPSDSPRSTCTLKR